MFHMLEEEYHLHQIHWLKLIDYYAIHLLRMGEKMETSQDFCSFIVFLTENISFKNGSILSLQSFQLGHRHVTQTIRML